jgi:glycine dehydrogenase subunit 1
MPYIPNTLEDQQQMLATIGATSIDELFSMIPPELRLKGDLCLLPAMGELELTAHMVELSGRNLSAACVPCFLGGGTYDHFIPAAVDAIASRS